MAQPPRESQLERIRQAIDESLGPLPAAALGLQVRAFGPYRLGRLIGEGGHGLVFRAEPEAGGPAVALKMPRPRVMADPALRQRFLVEARAMAALDHPALMPILDTGEIDGTPYFTMPLCEGGHLADWLRAHPPTAADAARLVIRLAEGADHAHARGILHRDLKPGNVLFLADPAATAWPVGWSPRITDFGLARIVDEAGETQTGVAIGTQYYLPPEQAAGRRHEIGPRSDVYGLGAILHELLQGRPPMADLATGEVYGRLLDSAARILPVTRWTGVPAAFEAVARKCLERDPARRYATAAELAADLRRAVAGDATTARLPAWPVRAVDFTRRNRRAFLAGAVGAAGGAFAWVARGGKPNNAAATDPWAGATAYAAELGRAVRLIVNGRPAAAREALDRARRDPDVARWIGPIQAAVEDRIRRDATEPRIFEGHAKPVADVAFTPDARTLFSCDEDGMIFRWDVATGERVWQIRKAFGSHLAVSPDGLWVAVTRSDYSTDLYAIDCGKEADSFQMSRRLQFTPDGDTLVGILEPADSATLVRYHLSTRTVNKWDLPTKQRIQAFCLPPDGETVVALQTGQPIKRYRIADRKELWAEPGWTVTTEDPESNLAPAADGRLVFFTDPSRVEAFALCARSGQPVWRSQPAARGAVCSAVSPDGRTFASALHDGSIQLWSTEDVLPRVPFVRHPTPLLWAVAFAPDGRTAYSVGQSFLLMRWRFGDDGTLSPSGTGRTTLGTTSSVVASPDGRFLATGDYDRSVILWDAETLERRHEWKCREPVRSVAFSPDAATVYATDKAGDLTAWSVATKQQIYRIQAHRFVVKCLAVSPDGGTIFTGAGDTAIGEVRLWKAADGYAIDEIKVADDTAALALSRCGRFLAVANDSDHRIQVWNLERKRVIGAWPGGGGHVFAMAFGPGGAVLVAASADGSVRAFDVAQNLELFTLAHFDAPARTLAYAADFRRLIVGFADGRIAWWPGPEVKRPPGA